MSKAGVESILTRLIPRSTQSQQVSQPMRLRQRYLQHFHASGTSSMSRSQYSSGNLGPEFRHNFEDSKLAGFNKSVRAANSATRITVAAS